MIRLVNRLTGTLMLVAPEREAEYLAAGHSMLAGADVPPAAKEKASPATAKAAKSVSLPKPETARTAAKRPAKAAQKKRG